MNLISLLTAAHSGSAVARCGKPVSFPEVRNLRPSNGLPKFFPQDAGRELLAAAVLSRIEIDRHCNQLQLDRTATLVACRSFKCDSAAMMHNLYWEDRL